VVDRVTVVEDGVESESAGEGVVRAVVQPVGVKVGLRVRVSVVEVRVGGRLRVGNVD
jgi:hypothetical protein